MNRARKESQISGKQFTYLDQENFIQMTLTRRLRKGHHKKQRVRTQQGCSGRHSWPQSSFAKSISLGLKTRVLDAIVHAIHNTCILIIARGALIESAVVSGWEGASGPSEEFSFFPETHEQARIT